MKKCVDVFSNSGIRPRVRAFCAMLAFEIKSVLPTILYIN